MHRVTVGITTRDRPQALLRCVRSLQRIAPLVSEIIVVDDASTEPAELVLRRAFGTNAPAPLVVVRHPTPIGYIVARNHIAARASSELILSLDDDAAIGDPAAIHDAIAVIGADEQVAAVAFAQADAEGRPWPALMQPARVDYSCRVGAFIGFAALIRRRTFLRLNGYRDLFTFYGEEKELGLRLLDAGQTIVYLPHARVLHVPDPAGRSQQRYLRQVARNDCLGALFNHPLPLVLVRIPQHLLWYTRMRRAWKVDDRGGLRWLLGEILSNLSQVWAQRRPVRWSTVRRWRAMRANPPAYPAPAHATAAPAA